KTRTFAMPNDTAPIKAAAATEAPSTPAAANRRQLEVGYLLAAIGAILFSTKAVAIKFAYQDHVDAETLLALRMGLATPFYLVIAAHSLSRSRQGRSSPLAAREGRHTGRKLPGIRRVAAACGVGLLGYWVASYLDFLGLEY